MCINDLERRIRSRFNHKIIFLPYLHSDTVRKILGLECISPNTIKTCDKVIKEFLMKKYKVKKYELDDLYSLLPPLHLSILILCEKIPLSNINIVDEFRKFTLKCKVLKNTSEIDVMNAYFDVLDSDLIDKRGRFKQDFDLFKNFIKKNNPYYIKSLLN